MPKGDKLTDITITDKGYVFQNGDLFEKIGKGALVNKTARFRNMVEAIGIRAGVLLRVKIEIKKGN